MARRALAVAIVVGLAVGVWLLWPRDQPTTSTTVPAAAPSSTTTSNTVASTSTSTTSIPESHVVETVEEAEVILRELWFGWFEGIYNQDEDRIREVVILESSVEAALDPSDPIEFQMEPSRSSIGLSQVSILRADMDCLALWARLDVSTLTGGSTDGVHVFRRIDDSWKFLSLWALREDMWETDCSASLPSR